jgi:hypothetical protein
MSMSELGELVVDAHGGIERWNKVKAIEGDMSITGAMWARKGWPDALKAVRVTADTRYQWISYRPFISEGMCSVCTPDRTLIETKDGKPIKDRKNPRAAFDGHTVETRWDDLNLAYFSGYAMWNYLITPFIFALPGFKTEEIEPWQEDGGKRRRLKVVFPDHIATHCPEQIFHVNDEGLICRMDYSAAVAGGAPTAHYLSEYKDFSGIKIATKRRALRRNADGTAIPDPVFVAIDIADIRLS